MKKWITPLVVLASNLYSFPYNVTYPYGVKPTKTQQEMNQHVQFLFEDYRNRYFTQQGTPQSGMWRVKLRGQYADDGIYYPNCTVSEAQGYGMLIAVLMDNSVNNTKQIYDGLFKYYKYYANSNGVMKWIIDENGIPRSNGAATDGDLDAAMSLILAHYKWGSKGEINYEQEAKNLLENILRCMVDTNDVLKPGDTWGGISITRPSDYMTGFFKVFYYFTGERRWLRIVDSCYYTLDYFYRTYPTGLIADFCKADGTPATRVIENTLSQDPPTDYIYGYNACRVPWRLGYDWLWFGDERAYRILNKITNWIKTKTNHNVNEIKDGYSLNGEILSSWQSPAFVAPFGVAATSNLEHQQWLDDIYNWLINKPSYGYYADSIRLLSLLLITGNFPNFISFNPFVYFLNLTDHGIISGVYSVEVGVFGVSTSTVKIEFYVNEECKFIDDTFPYVWNFDTYSYEDGKYNLKIKAFSNDQLFEEKQLTINIKNTKSSQIYVDNNPFIISQHTKCRFYNIPKGKSLKILNFSGEIIFISVSENGIVEWEGKDKTGRYVNSGVYFYIVEDKVQKIGVIR